MRLLDELVNERERNVVIYNAKESMFAMIVKNVNECEFGWTQNDRNRRKTIAIAYVK